MTPQEKARELYNKMDWFTHGYVGSSMLSNTEFDEVKIKNTKSAALIIVEEILNANPTWFIDQSKSTHKYWEAVRDALKAL
jgi:hypothetical protein